MLLDVKNGQGYYKFLSYLNDLLGRQSQLITDKRYFSEGKEKGRDKIAALIVQELITYLCLKIFHSPDRPVKTPGPGATKSDSGSGVPGSM